MHSNFKVVQSVHYGAMYAFVYCTNQTHNIKYI